jgi:hypothetical protein
MSRALDDVCKTLNLSDDARSSERPLLSAIIELARRGERRPELLRDRILQDSGPIGRMVSAARAYIGQAFSALLV